MASPQRRPRPCGPASARSQRPYLNAGGGRPIPTQRSLRTRPVRWKVRVFVSYAYDSADHRQRVLRLCEFLRDRGCEVHVDVWSGGRRRDWYLWAIQQIKRAHFVIVVASPACRLAGEGRLSDQVHRGVQTELSLLREMLHANRRVWQRKILPVIIPGSRHRDIPLFLLPHSADYYAVNALTDAGAAELLTALGLARPLRA